MSLASRLSSASGRDELDALLARLDVLEEAVAEQTALDSATAADLDELGARLVELASRRRGED